MARRPEGSTRRRRAAWRVRDVVSSQLWPIPVAAVVAAVLLGYGVPLLDILLEDRFPDWLQALVFNGDAAAASTLVDAVASSLITVTSLTFSLTVVTLQLASSQFSPSLLRTFVQDRFVQATLALFLGTFVYSLTVLRSIRSEDASEGELVPRMAISLAFLLATASVLVLVLFLAHLVRQIRRETIVVTVHATASRTIAALLDDHPDTERNAPLPEPPASAPRLLARRSGFLVHVDVQRLGRLAEELDVVLVVTTLPGAFVVAGTPVGHWWPRGTTLSSSDHDRLLDGAEQTLRIGAERTAAQDIGYGLRQLTDVANKALSPGSSDPTTAVHAINHQAALLSELARRPLGPLLLHDESGVVRLGLARPDLPHLLDQAFAQPRHYARDAPVVTEELFRALAAVAWNSHPRRESREAVAAALERLEATVAGSSFDDADRAQLSAAADDVRRSLAAAEPAGHTR